MRSPRLARFVAPLGTTVPLLLALACSPSGAPLTPSPPAPTPLPIVEAPRSAASASTEREPTAGEAAEFVAETDRELRRVWTRQARADWINQNYLTDDTDALAADAGEESMAVLTARAVASAKYRKVKGLAPDVARQLALLRKSTALPSPSDPEARKELAQIAVSMPSAYGKGKYCSPKLRRFAAKDAKDDCLTLDELSAVLEDPKANWDELVEAFVGWRTVGKPLRAPFERFVTLANQGARELGYSDAGEL